MGMEHYCRADEIELRSIAGEHFLIVLHAGESRMFSLNGMGLWFWQQLARPVTKHDLLSAMSAEYDVAEAVAATEIDRFLADMIGKGLAKQAEGGPGL